jgi:hypothetical protein
VLPHVERKMCWEKMIYYKGISTLGKISQYHGGIVHNHHSVVLFCEDYLTWLLGDLVQEINVRCLDRSVCLIIGRIIIL